jgi:hypothetical protein
MIDQDSFLFEDVLTKQVPSGMNSSLAIAAKNPLLKGRAGNYRIRWARSCVSPSSYEGETLNLQERFEKHAWNLSHLGMDPSKYMVTITTTANTRDARKAGKEKQLRAELKAQQAANITAARARGEPLTNVQDGEAEYLFEVLPTAEADPMASDAARQRKKAKKEALQAARIEAQQRGAELVKQYMRELDRAGDRSGQTVRGQAKKRAGAELIRLSKSFPNRDLRYTAFQTVGNMLIDRGNADLHPGKGLKGVSR